MPLGTAFGCGVSGAFVVYCLMYRDSRIKEFAESPRSKWMVLAFDLILFLACGGLVASMGVESNTTTQAFTAGCAWQGIAGGIVTGIELEALKKAVRPSARRAGRRR